MRTGTFLPPKFSSKLKLLPSTKNINDLQKRETTNASGQSSSSITHVKPTEDIKGKYVSIRITLEKRI